MTNRSPLAGTGFFRIWAGESVSLVGSQVTFFALPLVAVLTLKANAVDMGVLAASGSLAVVLLGPSLGVVADRYDQRRIMLLANLGRAVLLAVVPLLYLLGALNLTALLLVSFGVGGLSLLFDSAMASYVPALVGPSRLVPANSWLQSSVSVADTAGPGLAGTVVQLLGAPLAIVVDAVSYLASSVALAKSPPVRTRAEDDEDELHWSAIKRGLRAVLGDRVQRPLVLAAAHFNLFTAMFFALYTFFLVRTLHFSPLLIGLLNVAGGVSGLAGAGISNRLTRRFGYGPVLTVAYLLPGVAAVLVPIAAGAGAPVAAILVALSSAVWSGSVVVNLILSESVKQALVPHDLLGRATSVIRFVSYGVEPVGALLGSALVALGVGTGGILVVGAIGVGSSALWLVAGRVTTLRRVEPEFPAGELVTVEEH